MASDCTALCHTGMTLEQKLASGIYTYEAQRLLSEQHIHTEVYLKSVDEIEEYMQVLKHRILQHAPDADVQIMGGCGGGSVWVELPGWEHPSVIWVKHPGAKIEVNEDGVAVTREPAPGLVGASEESKNQLMVMLGVPAGFVLSDGKLVKKDAPENESSQ